MRRALLVLVLVLLALFAFWPLPRVAWVDPAVGVCLRGPAGLECRP